jgi:hypothetical protein
MPLLPYLPEFHKKYDMLLLFHNFELQCEPQAIAAPTGTPIAILANFV